MIIQGERPKAAPMPEPGYWWIKTTRPRILVSADTYFLTWADTAPSKWILAQIVGTPLNYVFLFGTDIDLEWDGKECVVVEVGPRVEPPA